MNVDENVFGRIFLNLQWMVTIVKNGIPLFFPLKIHALGIHRLFLVVHVFFLWGWPNFYVEGKEYNKELKSVEIIDHF